MTLEDIKSRHSVRNFSTKPISDTDAATLRAELTMINTHEAGLNFRLMLNDSSPIKAFDASYGQFRNARNYVAVIVDRSFADAEERAGFYAEQFVMKATIMHIGTCIVSGTFRKDAIPVPLRAGQEILFIILVGYPNDEQKAPLMARITKTIAHRKTMKPEDFYVEKDGISYEEACKRFPFLKNGMEGLAAAPSAMNRRPVRVWVGKYEDKDVIRIGIPDIKDSQYIDLGIAKYNFSELSGGYFDWGNCAALFF